MKATPKYLGRAGSELAKERLSQYVRYGELVAEQEAALDQGDLERFDELAGMVADLRVEIGMATPIVELLDDPSGAGSDVVEALRKALAANQRIQDRLVEMRKDSAGLIRTVRERKPHARTYASESAEEPSGKLDLTL